MVGDIAYSRSPYAVSSVMWWRRQRGFSKKLLWCFGFIDALQAHRSKVARKSDGHAGAILRHLEGFNVACPS